MTMRYRLRARAVSVFAGLLVSGVLLIVMCGCASEPVGHTKTTTKTTTNTPTEKTTVTETHEKDTTISPK